MGVITIYVPNENSEEAKKLVSYLIEKKFIACSHKLPVDCYCMWNNEIKSETEIVTILKTRSENWEFLKKEIEKIHTYQCPCILKFDCESNEAYEKWIYDETIDCNLL